MRDSIAAFVFGLATLTVGVARAEVAAVPAAADYIASAKQFHRIVACGGTDALPATTDAKIVDKHCVEMAKRFASFQTKYITPAQTFFAGVRRRTGRRRSSAATWRAHS